MQSDLLGPCDDIVCASEEFGIDFEAEIAVVTGDIAMGSGPDEALDGIRLLMLANDVSLRNLIPAELAKGFGFFQSKPATAFSPVAVTPDELGAAWQGGRVHLDLESSWNGKRVGRCNAGPEMTFHFGQLIAHICKTRNVRAGSIVGSGTVSNRDWSHGYSCIAEKRAIETIENGAPQTGVHALRRPHPHRDEGRRRRQRLRRDRPARRRHDAMRPPPGRPKVAATPSGGRLRYRVAARHR